MVNFKDFEKFDTFEEQCLYYLNITDSGDYYDIDYSLRILLVGDYLFKEWKYALFSNREIDSFILTLKHYDKIHLEILREICAERHRVINDDDDFEEKIQFIQKTLKKYHLI